LKILLEKNNTKEIVLSNPDLMFCPIANCEGYCNKKSNSKFNLCNMGHNFCPICGELYHKDGICKEGEKVNEIFELYYKIYKLKKCPFCQIVTKKNGGCNHITCLYCGKNWCWLCNELFETTEEHYGNIKSKCYNKMYPNDENNNLLICDKCENETEDFQYFLECDHIICNNCFEKHLLENNFILIFPRKVIKCLITHCNNYELYARNRLNRYIKEELNNQNLVKKYRSQLLINEYFILPFYLFEDNNYMKIIFGLFGFIKDKSCKNSENNCILQNLFSIFSILILLIFPLFPHFSIKKIYYHKFLKEIKNKQNNKILLILIILGENILFLILLFPLMIIHYLYTIIFSPI